MPTHEVELLVRFPRSDSTPFAAAARSGTVSAAGLAIEPLFDTATETSAAGLGLSATERTPVREWYAVRPREGDSDNPWDLAHEAAARIGAGPSFAAAAAPDIVEPNLKQQWVWTPPREPEALGVAEVCKFFDQNLNLPFRTGAFAWHLDDAYSQLRSAREHAASANGAVAIRIGHLDTGYDPNHDAFADTKILRALERNFVDADRLKDAADRGVEGTLKNPYHGTGTLGILAGGKFKFVGSGYSFDGILGGASNAEIVPIRVGNSVVQLTTKDVALGIAYAAQLCDDEGTRIHVLSMSMGGVASAAWADAVNKAYEAGIVFVAAAGNNYSAGWFGLPTRHVVYPARFRRVIAACGVMADRKPYFGLSAGTMQGNWGPPGAMATALAAFTPNVPWAQGGCEKIVRMDGAGTSSATPQIAAAAALYLQYHAKALFDETRYAEPWMRVEAVRHALFRSAAAANSEEDREKLGNGLLRARAALDMAPVMASALQKTSRDSAGFPFLNVLSSRGLAPSRSDAMLRLEATQLALQWSKPGEPNPLEDAVGDPDRPAQDIATDRVERFLEVVAEHPQASQKLRDRAKETLAGMGGSRSSSRTREARPSEPRRRIYDETSVGGAKASGAVHVDQERVTPLRTPPPPHRRLRGYAVDPSLATRLETANIAEVIFRVPWEELKPGPVGEYLEVVDIDPPSRTFYDPVDLDDPKLLAQDGLPASEGVPQFHQQMVYAVCSLTIRNFERALGRKALWRPGKGAHLKDDSRFVQQLRIYPHALREANAYYSPAKVALLFGYFDAVDVNDGTMLPGARIFTCLSHDIVAHETTHALLDGMHRRFLLPTNPDVHAFHEAFADCVAMLQHFTFPELVADQIRATRGQIQTQRNILVQLAIQFGFATGRRTALRDAVGRTGEDGKWLSEEHPDPLEYEKTTESHDRGRILVAAVFDAFLSIYRRRTTDLLRLATGGSGELPAGAIHPDLVGRLAEEASKSAQHVLTMCIRALDYCPPTDITFGEYLRALITADCDVVEDDRYQYRVSFVEAFQKRGIFPPGVRTLSVGNLKWRRVEEETLSHSGWFSTQIPMLRAASESTLYAPSRHAIFTIERNLRIRIHEALGKHLREKTDESRADAKFFGLDPGRSFEVHTARVAFRPRPNGGISPQMLVGLLQSSKRPVDASDPNGPKMAFEGGCSIVVDLFDGVVRYCIRKNIQSETRLDHQRSFALREFDSLRSTYLGRRALDAGSDDSDDEPFALMHRGL